MKHIFYITSVCLIALFAMSCDGNRNQNQQTVEVTEMAETVGTRATGAVGYTWILVQMHGEEVPASEDAERQPRFTLNVDNTVFGHGGCNTFSGTFNIEGENQIRFSQMGATRMYCMDAMEIEDKFFRVLEIADNFVISSCCGKLSLNEGETRLARFEMVQE